MLKVIYGREHVNGDYELDTRITFSREKKPEWFEDNFIKRVLKGIEGTTVLFEEVLKDKFGHGISTEMISTGCKTLCCIYYDRKDRVWNGSAMGDNCLPYLFEIARKRAVTVFLEHYPYIDNEFFEEGIICDINGRVLGEYDFDDLFSGWCAESTKYCEEDEDEFQIIVDEEDE